MNRRELLKGAAALALTPLLPDAVMAAVESPPTKSLVAPCHVPVYEVANHTMMIDVRGNYDVWELLQHWDQVLDVGNGWHRLIKTRKGRPSEKMTFIFPFSVDCVANPSVTVDFAPEATAYIPNTAQAELPFMPPSPERPPWQLKRIASVVREGGSG